MNKIIKAEFIGKDVKLFEIEAPRIAVKRQAGQFVILRVHANGERIPITIADSNPEKGSITIIVQGIGATTKKLLLKESGETIHDMVGPLGKPTPIHKMKSVVIMSGGVGTAEALPIAQAHTAAGNKVYSIIGARTKDLVIVEKEMAERAHKVMITTDDGSHGKKGLVTHAFQDLLDEGIIPDEVVAIGPLPMMKAVSDMTKPLNIKTVVSLNSIMIDGTGMCGGCRATVGGKIVFVCVDGPEFDAHEVDFDELRTRQRAYLGEEKRSIEEHNHQCRLDAAAAE